MVKQMRKMRPPGAALLLSALALVALLHGAAAATRRRTPPPPPPPRNCTTTPCTHGQCTTSGCCDDDHCTNGATCNEGNGVCACACQNNGACAKADGGCTCTGTGYSGLQCKISVKCGMLPTVSNASWGSGSGCPAAGAELTYPNKCTVACDMGYTGGGSSKQFSCTKGGHMTPAAGFTCTGAAPSFLPRMLACQAVN